MLNVFTIYKYLYLIDYHGRYIPSKTMQARPNSSDMKDIMETEFLVTKEVVDTICEYIEDDPVALRDWNAKIKDKFVASERNRLTVSKEYMTMNISLAIKLTLQIWMSEQGRPTMTNCITILRDCQLNNLADRITENAKQIRTPYSGSTRSKSLNRSVGSHEQLPARATTETATSPGSSSTALSQNDLDAIFFNEVRSKVAFHFVERKSVLKELHQLVTNYHGTSNSIYSLLCSLSGLGGIGKTTLARRYTDYFLVAYPGAEIVWVEAETHQTLTNAFRKLAKRHNIPDNIDISTLVEAVYQSLLDKRCLFVFDNASDYVGDNGVFPFLPSQLNPLHYILMTSRKQDLTDRVLPLGVLTKVESIALVRMVLPNCSDESCSKLCTTLGNLPLALQQALAYIRNVRALKTSDTCAIETYLQEYEINARKVLKSDLLNKEGQPIPKSIYVTWKTTLSSISGQTYGRLAILILRCMAYLNPDNIDIKFLFAIDVNFSFLSVVRSRVNRCSIFKELFGTPIKVTATPIQYRQDVGEAVKLLIKYSMVAAQDGMLSIHRLVQEVIRIRTNGGLSDECMFVERIVAHLDQFLGTQHNLDQCLLHGTSLLPFYELYSSVYCGLKQFSVTMPSDLQLLEYVMAETGCSDTGDAIKLIQLLQKDKESITSALSCIRILANENSLRQYVHYLDSGGKFPGIERMNWMVLSLELNDSALVKIMQILPYLHDSLITTRFISTISCENELIVQDLVQKLQSCGILTNDGDKFVLHMGIEPDREVLSPWAVHILEFVSQNFNSQVSTRDCSALAAYLKTKYPALVSKFSNNQLKGYIATVEWSTVAESMHLPSRFLGLPWFNHEVIAYAEEFITKLDRQLSEAFFSIDNLHEGNITGCSVYINVCKSLQNQREFDEVKSLGPKSLVEYLSWFVARRVLRPTLVGEILDILFGLYIPVSIDYLRDILPADNFASEDLFMDCLALLRHYNLITMAKGQGQGISTPQIPQELRSCVQRHAHGIKHSVLGITCFDPPAAPFLM